MNVSAAILDYYYERYQIEYQANMTLEQVSYEDWFSMRTKQEKSELLEDFGKWFEDEKNQEKYWFRNKGK